jgi:CRISPR-associated protein Cse2 (CRISPR_cse2)
MNEYFEYLQQLRPEQLRVIGGAWPTSLIQIERAFPSLIGWTIQRRTARLISAGVFATHPITGEIGLIPAIRAHVHEADLRAVLAQDLEHLGRTLIRWVKVIPEGTKLDHLALHKDLLSWPHPKRYVQDRWWRIFHTDPLTPSNRVD